jgi:hypothetical protein
MRQKSKLVISIFIFGLLLLLSACSPNGGKTPAAGSTPAEKVESPVPVDTVEPAVPTAEPTAESAPAGETYLGDYVAKSGYYFAVLKIEDPAAPPEGYDLPAGTRLVAVYLAVGNQSGQNLMARDSNCKLKDADGALYSYASDASSLIMPGVTIDPGERAEGWLVYPVPSGAKPVQLEWNYWMGEEGTIRLGLANPPAGHTPLKVDTTRAVTERSKLGETAKAGGLALTALQVEDPAAPEEKIYGLGVPTGWHLMAVEVEFVNESVEGLSLLSFDFNVVTTEGYVYDNFYWGRAGGIESGDLAIGAKRQGWLTFMVPDGVKLESVKYYTYLGGDKELLVYAGLQK